MLYHTNKLTYNILLHYFDSLKYKLSSMGSQSEAGRTYSPEGAYIYLGTASVNMSSPLNWVVSF